MRLVGLGIMPLQLLNLGIIIPRVVMRLFFTRTPRGTHVVLVFQPNSTDAIRGTRLRRAQRTADDQLRRCISASNPDVHYHLAI